MRFLKKCLGAICGLSLAAGVLTGCGDGGSGSNIAYLCFDESDAFGGQLIKSEFQKGASAKSLDVTYYDAKGDGNLQIDQMKEIISNNPKAIILLPVDGDLLIPSVEQANEQDIPVVVLNRGVNGGKVLTSGSNDLDAGILQAQFMASHLPQGAKVVYLHGASNQSAAQLRWQGFKKECLDKRPDIELLDMQDGNWSKTEGMKIMALWLSLYPKIDGVICGNDQMALGAIAALKAANRLAGCQVSGVDAVDDALKAVATGEMVQTIKQDAAGQAQGAVDIVASIVSGGSPSNVVVPFTSITKDNVAQFRK